MKSSVSIPKSTTKLFFNGSSGFNCVYFFTSEYTMKKGFNDLNLKIRPEPKIANFLITILRSFYDSVIQSS